MPDAILEHLKEIIEGQKKIISLLEEPHRKDPPKVPQICQRCKGSGSEKVRSDAKVWVETTQTCPACRGIGAVLA